MTDAAILAVEERATPSGAVLALATLNSPKTLNGLSLEMAAALDDRLARWARDARVAAVVLQGAGGKAFCAGGDLHALYRSMREARVTGAGGALANEYARAFFATEYRLDYRIHTYPKPVVCWGDGVVMGGGIGLMAGASHRVVTERSRLAMPEITVGLYPDVGGSWILNRVPMRGGRFLALTGATLNAADAVLCGLADHVVDEAQRADVLARLTMLPFGERGDDNHRLVSHVLRSFSHAAVPRGPFGMNLDRIHEACSLPTLDEAVAAILRLREGETPDSWIAKGAAALQAGSPGSARIGWEIQERTRHLSLADVFRLEYIVSLHCAAHGDFEEGIRALLIDKDRHPSWHPAALDEASVAWADPFFAPPWAPGTHPLRDLEASVGG